MSTAEAAVTVPRGTGKGALNLQDSYSSEKQKSKGVMAAPSNSPRFPRDGPELPSWSSGFYNKFSPFHNPLREFIKILP